ncbi:MAG: hypothetical protein Q9218_006354 [Villophora microphyllina]
MSPEKDLVFINTNSPEDSKSSEKRKAVRSQAAKDQSQDPSSKPEGTKPRRHKKLPTVEIELNVADPPQGNPSLPGSTQGSQPKAAAQTVPATTGLIPRPVSGTGWVSPLVPYPDKFFVPGVPSQCMSDRFLHQYWLFWHPDFYVCVYSDHIANICHVEADLAELAIGIPDLGQPNDTGSLRSIWFPMVSADRSTLDLVVLTAGTQTISVGRAQCNPSILVKFKEHAISSINRALRGANPVITDRLLGAAAKMAAYEAGFAKDPKQFHVHMKGLIKMVELRGGLESLGMNGLLARMLLWVDLNAAYILKTKMYFSHAKT